MPPSSWIIKGPSNNCAVKKYQGLFNEANVSLSVRSSLKVMTFAPFKFDLFSPKSDHYSPFHSVLEKPKRRDHRPLKMSKLASNVSHFKRSSFGIDLLKNSKLFSHINAERTFVVSFYSTCNFNVCSLFPGLLKIASGS